MRRSRAAVAASVVAGMIATVGVVIGPASAEEITTPTANLAMTGSGPEAMGTKTPFEHIFTVVNNGPDATQRAWIQVQIPDGATLISSGDCFPRIAPDPETTPRYMCELGVMQAGQEKSATFVLSAKKKGTYWSRGVASDMYDEDGTQNIVMLTTLVGNR